MSAFVVNKKTIDCIVSELFISSGYRNYDYLIDKILPHELKHPDTPTKKKQTYISAKQSGI